jgi:hypothetical protein
MARIRRSNIHILDELSKKVIFAAIGAGKTLEQLSQCTLCAATAIDKSLDSGPSRKSANPPAPGLGGRGVSRKLC